MASPPANVNFGPIERGELHFGRAVADIDPLMESQRSGGGDALVEYADLPSKRGHQD